MNKINLLSSVVLVFTLAACQSSTKHSDRNPAQNPQGTGEIGSVDSGFTSNCTGEIDKSQSNIQRLYEEGKLEEGEYSVLLEMYNSAKTVSLMACHELGTILSPNEMNFVREVNQARCQKDIQRMEAQLAEWQKQAPKSESVRKLKKDIKEKRETCKKIEKKFRTNQ